MNEWRLQNVWRNKQRPARAVTLGQPLNYLVKQRLAKRVRQIGLLSTIWDECIPDSIREHTGLVNFARGTLTVAVDSAGHRYQLQTLLADGLIEAIRERFSGPLDRVKLVPGQFDFLEMPDRPIGRA